MNRQHKYTRLGLETLEGRSLMAGGLMASSLGGLAGATALVGSRVAGNNNAAVAVDLSGTWYINGVKCSITQFGDKLTFTNEQGQTSQGYLMPNGQVKATDWNLVGTLTQNNTRIMWANGSVWNRQAPVDLSGKWYINGKPCTIQQSGNNLIFTNERGQQSQGYIRPDGSVVATNWGNLIGRLSQNNTRITWNNGSVWTRQPR